MTEDLVGIILLLGALQGLFLSALLLTKFKSVKANRYLAFLILAFALFVFNNFISGIAEIYLTFPYFPLIFSGLPFLFGPLHLIYIGELTDSRSKFTRFSWWHFLPFLIYRIYYTWPFFIPADELRTIMVQIIKLNYIPTHILISGIIVSIQGMFYAVFALWILKKYTQKVRFTFSALEKINLNWLNYFAWVNLFVWSIVFTENSLHIFDEQYVFFEHLVPLLTSVFIYATGYIGIYKSEIFTQPQISVSLHEARELAWGQNEQGNGDSKESKYQKSGLSEENADAYLEHILILMDKEKPFMNPELTLKDLSDITGISTHNLSEVLNTRLNQNFFDFINSYRIKKVQEDISGHDKDHLTLLAIAMDAGFNSKSGFNAIFKRFTGQTPSQYRNQVN